MTTQQMAYFLELANELHYWRTSYKMNITQSALSRQIKALEEELNVELFLRHNRKVELTAAGKFLQQQWGPLQEQLQTTLTYAQKLAKGESGTITINHPGSVSYSVIPELLTKVARLYPNVKVELIQLKQDQEVEFLNTYKADLSFSRTLYETEFLTQRLLLQEHLCVAVPEAYAVEQEADLTAALLQQQRFILPAMKPGDSYPEHIVQVFNRYGIHPDISFISDFGTAILNLVESGLGISIMPYSFARSKHPGVRFIPLTDTIPLYLYWRKEEENILIKNILYLV